MERIKTFAVGVAEAAALLAVIRLAGGWWALPLGFLIWWWQHRQVDATTSALGAVAVGGLGLMLALNHHWLGQATLLIGYGLWRFGRKYYAKDLKFQVWQAGGLEFIALSGIFGAEAIWHWPTVFSLTLAYLASLAVARGFIAPGDRASAALAAAWALIVVEASLIFSVWLVQYVLPKDLLLIPQPAVVITVLGYCFGSIYVAHSSSRLSRARLAEYAIIGLCLVAIVIAGTHWNGSV